jgi:hypothetical protein
MWFFLLRNFKDDRYTQRLSQKSFKKQARPRPDFAKSDVFFKEKLALARTSICQEISIL